MLAQSKGLHREKSFGVIQGNQFGQSTEHLPAINLQGPVPLTESLHPRRSPSGNARTVQRRLSRLSPTDSARELSTQSAEPEEHAQLPHTSSHESAPAFAEPHRGTQTPARQLVADSAQETEAQRQNPDAWSELEQDAAGPSSSASVPPTIRHAGASTPSRLASGDSARELLISAASSNPSREPACDHHAGASICRAETLPQEANAEALHPPTPPIRPQQAAADLSHASGKAPSRGQFSQLPASAASLQLEEQSTGSSSAHTLQNGAMDQQEHAGASERASAGLVSRSDSASSTTARSGLLSLTASPEGPQLLQSSAHGSHGGSPPAIEGHLSSPRSVNASPAVAIEHHTLLLCSIRQAWMDADGNRIAHRLIYVLIWPHMTA